MKYFKILILSFILILSTVATGEDIAEGVASWYSVKTNGGTATASGEKFNENAMTAAHKTLPMGTKVKVTNLENGKEVIVRINDRGPFIKGRHIDLSIGAFSKIASVNKGLAKVKIEVL